MVRFVFALIIGLASGYYYGWTDHEKHDQHIVERLTKRAGGSARDMVKTDADSLANSVEDAATGGRR